MIETNGTTFKRNTVAITPEANQNNHQSVMRYVAMYVHITLHMLTRLANMLTAKLAASAVSK